MPKFSQVPTNASPALTDFLLGVSSGNVDQKTTLAIIAALVSANLTNNVITSSKIDWAAATGKIWWEELSRTTLGAGATSITSSSFTARKYLRIIAQFRVTGVNWGSGRLRFNGDTGTNYAYRLSTNAGADSTGSSDGVPIDTGSTGNGMHILVLDINNVATTEKPVYGAIVDSGSANGVANIMNRREIAAKWANTASQITSISAVNGTASSSFAAGSEIIVLGHD